MQDGAAWSDAAQQRAFQGATLGLFGRPKRPYSSRDPIIIIRFTTDGLSSLPPLPRHPRHDAGFAASYRRPMHEPGLLRLQFGKCAWREAVERGRRLAPPPTHASSLPLQCFKQARGRSRLHSVVYAAVPRDLGAAAKQAAGAVLGVAAAASLLLPAMPALAVSGGGGACSCLACL